MFLTDFLEDSSRKRCLVSMLLDSGVNNLQKDFFSNPKIELNNLLDEVLGYLDSGKSLYQKWVYQNGNKGRLLSVPVGPLRVFIDKYLLEFVKKKQVHSCCHGGEKSWSVKKSLETHLPCKTVLSFDLESAFQNVGFSQVRNYFTGLVRETRSDYLEDTAEFLSILSTVNYSSYRALPQGSPLSLALFNRILYHLDDLLCEGSISRGFRYSRWIDDLTISSDRHESEKPFFGAVVLTDRFFPVSKTKVYFQQKPPVYLLGYRLERLSVIKNSLQERESNKNSFLDYSSLFEGSKISSYESWC